MKKVTETVWMTDDQNATLLRQKEPGKFSVIPGNCDRETLAELGEAIADALRMEKTPCES